MGADIHVKIVAFNHQTRYFEEVPLFRWDSKKGEYKDVDLFPGRNSEIFGALTNEEYHNYGHFPCRSVRFDSLEPEFREKIEKEFQTLGFYDFCEVSLESFCGYLREHPKVKDYDEIWEADNPVYKDNPLKDLYADCITYLQFATDWYIDVGDLSDYKVIYYFDH